jgi:hypothetical protein
VVVRLPQIKTLPPKEKPQIIAFGGINYGQGYRDGELAESHNLSSAHYPCMSQRAGRKREGALEGVSALYARGNLCFVKGTEFIYGGMSVGTVTPGEKQFATINTKIVIFPDKVYYDTATGDFGSLGASATILEGYAEFADSTLTDSMSGYIDFSQPGSMGLPYNTDTIIMVYETASIDKDTGNVVLGGGHKIPVQNVMIGDIIKRSDKSYGVVFQKYAYTLQVQLIITRHTAAYTGSDFTKIFEVGSAVEISGCEALPDNNGTRIIKEVSAGTLTFAEGTFTEGVESGAVTVARKIPDLDFICEADNRLWGCEGNTIYASALGDPRNFFVYDGLATDSYAVAVGTDGDFTGCAAFSSAILFFKEDCLHKVLGNLPENYTVYTYTIPGVQMGSSKSLSIINEVLYYKGRKGVYAYTGGAPSLISGVFGTREYGGAVAGTDGQRYYISMVRDGLSPELYVFDTLRGMWLREDATRALDFAALDGVLYYLDWETGRIYRTGQDDSEEGRIEWGMTFCPFTETTHGRKSYSRLMLRVDLDPGAWFKVEVRGDNEPFRQVFLSHDEHAKTAMVPIVPTRCDRFVVRISGLGRCMLRSFVREFRVGSEY